MKGVNNGVLQAAYRKLRKSEELEGYERKALEDFTDAFVTCLCQMHQCGGRRGSENCGGGELARTQQVLQERGKKELSMEVSPLSLGQDNLC